jgi:hypothetical protein
MALVDMVAGVLAPAAGVDELHPLTVVATTQRPATAAANFRRTLGDRFPEIHFEVLIFSSLACR